MEPLERYQIKKSIELEIEDILLDFASLYNKVTTSDLQGMASVKALEIIRLVKGA